MSRPTIAALAVLALAVVVGAASLLSGPVSDEGVVATVPAAEWVPARSTELPTDAPVLPDADTPGRLLVAEMPASQVSPDALASEQSPLVVHVAHADGRPAAGGRAVLYDAEHLVAQGVLDAQGRWEGAGVDGPVEFYVLGLTPELVREQWPTGRGHHDVTLPGDAGLQGQVLIDGAPPGQPFPLGITGDWGVLRLRPPHGEPPRGAHRPGEVTSTLGGGFLTDADGRFLLSGFADGSEVSLVWPRFYAVDDTTPAPFPVTVPATGVVIALKRPAMIRGRILTAEGQPAADARLLVQVRYTQAAPTGKHTARRSAASSSMTFQDSDVAEDGRFAIAIGNPFPPEDVADGAAALPPQIGLSVDLLARDPQGDWVRVHLPDVVWNRDHDLGDLALLPAKRVVLQVVDPQGVPIAGARVRPESENTHAPSVMLRTDELGTVEIDLSSATLGWATIVAEGFLTELVELVAASSADPLRVSLVPAPSVTLRLRGPWEDDPSTAAEWRFDFSVTALDSGFHDALLPVIAGEEPRREPDAMRVHAESWSGASGSTIYGDGRVKHSFTSDAPEWHFDGLRAHHSLSFQVSVVRAPEWFGTVPAGAAWEASDVLLKSGERRELVVDLDHLQPGR